MITAVGQRTEHWTDLFGLLAQREDLQLSVVLADVSARTELIMNDYAARYPQLRVVIAGHLLGERRSGHLASVLFAPGTLRRAVSFRPDVIHVIGEAAYLSTRQVLAWRRRRWPDVPVTLYAAQNVVVDFPAPFPALERHAYTVVDHALPITPAALDVMRSKGYRGSATVVPLGVDTARFTPSGRSTVRSDFTIGFVGKLEIHKGIDDLLTAAERMGARLLLVGRGSLRPQVEAAAQARPGRIELVDWVDHDELPALLHRMDVLALPSVEPVQRQVLPWAGVPLREQFGRALIEAMACGLPIVGSDLGETEHLMGEAGLLYPAGDVDALIVALSRLRDDRALAYRLGRIGYRRARIEFGWETIGHRLVRVWERAVTDQLDTLPTSASA